MKRVSKTKPTTEQMIAEFEAAPPNRMFDESHIAAVRGCSIGKLQSERVRKSGPRYYKDQTHVRYKKQDVVEYIESCYIRHDQQSAA